MYTSCVLLSRADSDALLGSDDTEQQDADAGVDAGVGVGAAAGLPKEAPLPKVGAPKVGAAVVEEEEKEDEPKVGAAAAPLPKVGAGELDPPNETCGMTPASCFVGDFMERLLNTFVVAAPGDCVAAAAGAATPIVKLSLLLPKEELPNTGAEFAAVAAGAAGAAAAAAAGAATPEVDGNVETVPPLALLNAALNASNSRRPRTLNATVFAVYP